MVNYGKVGNFPDFPQNSPYEKGDGIKNLESKMWKN